MLPTPYTLEMLSQEIHLLNHRSFVLPQKGAQWWRTERNAGNSDEHRAAELALFSTMI